MTGFFVGISGVKNNSAFKLIGNVIRIGRAMDNDIVIDDPRVSRLHAQLELRGNAYYITDMGSANGTWVNGFRLANQAALNFGDTVSFGEGNAFIYSLQPEREGEHTILEPLGAAASPYLARPRQVSPMPVQQSPLVPMPVATPARSSNAPLFAMFGMGTMILVIMAIAVVGGGLYLLLRPGQNPPAGYATAPAPAMAAIAPTYTPYPSPTPVPPSPTPYPTYTPVPPTPTAYPTYTAPPPTGTPYPTYTPFPEPSATPKVVYVQPTSAPTPTAEVSAAEKKPLYNITLRNMGYEQWGRPMTSCPCCAGEDDFNEFEPVRRFTTEVVLRNNSEMYISKRWIPDIYTAKGTNPNTCVFYYEDRAISPGEEVSATFFAYMELGDYVSAMTFQIQDTYIQLCISPNNIVSTCE